MKVEDFLSLPWKERYEYNLEQIKNTQKIWVLRKKDKYWFYKSPFGAQLLVWCSKSFVEYCLNENSPIKPFCMTIREFVDVYAEKCTKEKIKILIASMEEYRGKLMTMDEFLRYIGYQKIERCDNNIQQETSTLKMEYDTPSTHIQSSYEEENEELSEREIEILKDLLDYIDEQLGTTPCKNDLSLTKSFLKKKVSLAHHTWHDLSR